MEKLIQKIYELRTEVNKLHPIGKIEKITLDRFTMDMINRYFYEKLHSGNPDFALSPNELGKGCQRIFDIELEGQTY